MRSAALLILLALLVPGPAHARARADHAGWRACHCERYLDPHRTPPHRYGSTRYR